MDASAAIRSVLAPECFAGPLGSSRMVIAPDLFVPEVCNALRRYVRGGLLSREEAERHTLRALDLPDEMRPMADLVPDVLTLAAEMQVSTYDLFYLVLAKRNRAMLLTADGALRRAALAAGLESPGEEAG